MGADVDPLALGRGGGEGQHPYLPKIGTYFLLDVDVIDVMQVSPKSLQPRNPKQANRYFCPTLNFVKLVFRKTSEEENLFFKNSRCFLSPKPMGKSQIFGSN